MRLVVSQILRGLMEHQETDARGRIKRHSLLLVLDEFPQLGKLDFFEQAMGAMAGYGIKSFLVTQSLHHVTQIYGRVNTIIDNCHIVTAFAAADVETAQAISALAGDIYEMRPQETWSGKRTAFSLDHRSVAYREERRPLLMPGDVRQLKADEELIFVTGGKPIKAKKLRYDEEPIFRMRLLPAPPIERAKPINTDWTGVRAQGRVRPAERAPTPSASRPDNSVKATRVAPKPRPSAARTGDLLALINAPAPPPEAPASTATPAASERVQFDLRPRVPDGGTPKTGA
jgi:type IV secretion system protein VirD4